MPIASNVIITSFFTRAGVPANDIQTYNGQPIYAGVLYPQIRIWEVIAGNVQDNFIGAFEMIPVEDAPGPIEDGFYKYTFFDIGGYDPTKTYVFRTDGGPTLPPGERYQAGQMDPSQDVINIANQVWDEPMSQHLLANTTGFTLAQTEANTVAIANNLFLNPNSVLDLVQLILAYDTNRTKIDPVAKTLTVYENDCVTPLRVFQLLDTTGAPSITEVAERKPIAANDGLPVCP
jgi:hypothetical protein